MCDENVVKKSFCAQSKAGEVIENAKELIQVVTKITTDPNYIDDL